MDPTGEDTTSPSGTSGCDSLGKSSASNTSPPSSIEDKPLTSLDLLGAKSWATREHTSSAAGKELECLTTEILEQASLQKWDHPVMDHIVPDFIGEFDHSNGERIDSFKAYQEHHWKLAAQNPEYRFYPTNASAQVYESNGTASVHVLLKVIGHPKDVVRESVVILTAWLTVRLEEARADVEMLQAQGNSWDVLERVKDLGATNSPVHSPTGSTPAVHLARLFKDKRGSTLRCPDIALLEPARNLPVPGIL